MDGNGVGSKDPSNELNAFCRGVQITDADGVVQFDTVFPGHYAGRTAHIHVATHHGRGDVRVNDGRLLDNVVTHAGQMFFDQRLVDLVRKQAPYSENRQRETRNADDAYLAATAKGSDPVMSYDFVAWNPSDGVLGLYAWLAFGVNMTNTREIRYGQTYPGR